jgi:DNA polymerase-3 subunit delta'
LNCLQPVRAGNGTAVDCCDTCLNCRKIGEANHADVHWLRPESKLRVITIDQVRELMREINLKPTEAEYKVAVIVAADRLNVQAANAFLKTLEEPPPRSVLVLLSTTPQRLLETVLSRCLRLDFAGEGSRPLAPGDMDWLGDFSEMAAAGHKSLLGRYRLMDRLVQRLSGMKADIERSLTARSPLQRYEDAEKELRERWEDELSAAVEAEYRRQRADLLLVVQRWLREVWLHTLAAGQELLEFPLISGVSQVAQRITSEDALENLRIIEWTQRLLHTNVQEALALEVGLLKLRL